MPQTTKKVTHDHSSETLTLAADAKRAERAQEKSSFFGFGLLPDAVDMGSRLAGCCMEVHSDMVKALTECCNATVNSCNSLSANLMENGNRSLSNMMELSKEAVNCRTIGSVIELQQKATQQAIETCIDTTQKLSSCLHDCCMESLNPLQERAASISKKIAKAAAPKA